MERKDHLSFSTYCSSYVYCLSYLTRAGKDCYYLISGHSWPWLSAPVCTDFYQKCQYCPPCPPLHLHLYHHITHSRSENICCWGARSGFYFCFGYVGDGVTGLNEGSIWLYFLIIVCGLPAWVCDEITLVWQGVRSGVQLSWTGTRFWKCSQSV